MNPTTGRLEPLSREDADRHDQLTRALTASSEPRPKPDPADPATWDALAVGQVVTLHLGPTATFLFTVVELHPEYVRLRIAESAGKGKRWNLKAIPNRGGACRIGRMAFRIVGRTSKTLKLRPQGYVEEEAPHGAYDTPRPRHEGGVL